MDNKKRSNCPISYALELFGDKWSLLILRDIIFWDKKHYQEFAASAEKISTNILADRLYKLEIHGIIEKKIDEKNRKQYLYTPTIKAIDLIPMLTEMIIWSSKYDENSGVPDAIRRLLKKNKQKFIEDAISKINSKCSDNS